MKSLKRQRRLTKRYLTWDWRRLVTSTTPARDSLRRLGSMRESKAYQAARELPQGKPRNGAFKACRTAHGFPEYALHPFAAKSCKACWTGDHPDLFTIQKIASRAFGAVMQYACGRRGRPRYKRKCWLTSIEG